MEKHLSFKYGQFEDHIINKTCEECNVAYNDLNEDIEECPTCEGDLLNETALENETCSGCDKTFDMWEENVWQHEDGSHFICDDCFQEL